MKFAPLCWFVAGLTVPATLSAADIHAISPFEKSLLSGAARKLAVVPDIYETAHFAIAYTTSGVHAVNQAGLGLNSKGVPVVIDSLGKLAEQVWRLAIDTLGYPAPIPMDSAMGYGAKTRAGKFTIELMDLVSLQSGWADQGYFGYASRPSSDPGGLNRLELLLENDFIEGGSNKPLRVIVDPVNNNGDSVLYDYSKDPLKGWAVAFSHEFYHSLQYHWDAQYLYAFHEMTATWFATRAFPSIRHELQYLQIYLDNYWQSAFRSDSTYPYIHFGFVRALTRAYGDDVLKSLWPLHVSLFNPEESVWLHNSLMALKKDESILTMSLLKELLALYANAPSMHNNNGTFVLRPPTIRKWFLVQDSSDNSGVSGGGEYCGLLVRLASGQFESGWNVEFTDDLDSSGAAAGILSLPSKTIRVCHPAKGRVVMGKTDGDTAYILGLMPGILDQHTAHPNATFTTASQTGTRPRQPLLMGGSIKHRVDLHGRPVTSSTRGVVLERDFKSGWRRKVVVGE
jgi:hypothetical protein